MHDCQFCGCACYCGGDIDDIPVGDYCRVGCGCEEDEDDEFDHDAPRQEPITQRREQE